MATQVDNVIVGGSLMKAVLTLRLCVLALFSLLVAACNIFQFTPSLDLSVQSSDYTTATISIPYSFNTLSRNSDFGSADCAYRLERYDSYTGSFGWVTGNQNTMASTGTLSFPLESLLSLPAGSTAVDGLYRLTFAVLSGNYDQTGNPIPIPYLVKAVTFKVHTFQGPEIFRVQPAFLNPNNGSTTVTIYGAGFASVDTLVDSASAITASQYVDSATAQATVNASILATGSNLTIYVSNPIGNSSPNFDIPIVGNVSISSVVPNGDSRTNTNLLLDISGAWLGYWTTATITDSSGHVATMQVNQSDNSTYIRGPINLTPLDAGTATLKVSNPDGNSATIQFTVYS